MAAPRLTPIAVTELTPSTDFSWGTISGGRPADRAPDEFLMIRLPANEEFTDWLIVAFVPSASTATIATSAIPIVSAAAVVSVRPG